MTIAFPAPIEGAYLRDLLEQGEALRRAWREPLPADLSDLVRRLKADQPPYVVLTGMGSSFHALHPLALSLSRNGVRCIMLETSELLHYWSHLLEGDTILIAVSQSGRSAEMVRLLAMNAGKLPVVGITNDATSPLATQADWTLLLRAGPESTVSCKTYVATLLVLARLSAALFQQEPETELAPHVAEKVDQYLSHWREHVDEAQRCTDGIRSLVIAGRGTSLAAAGTGGLITKEAARFPAEGMSSAAFRHGPLEMAGNGLMLVLFEGDDHVADLNRRLAHDTAEAGGRVHLVSPSSESPLFRIPATTDAFPAHLRNSACADDLSGAGDPSGCRGRVVRVCDQDHGCRLAAHELCSRTFR